MNQNFKPELVPHFIYEYQDHCVLENGNTGEQGVFSREEGLYLKYFNGTMTLREIVNELQLNHPGFSFKSLVGLLNVLGKESFLKIPMKGTSEFEKTKDLFNKPAPFFARPIFKLKIFLSQPVKMKSSGLLFTLLTSVIIFMGALGIYFLWKDFSIKSDLVRYYGSILKGFGFLFLNFSILKTVKNVIKFAFSVIFNGRRPVTFIELNVYSLSLKVEDESLYYCVGAVKGALIVAALTLSYLAVSAIVYLVKDPWTYSLVTFSALVLTFVDINPYRKSELSRLLRLRLGSSVDSELLPYLKKRSLVAAVDQSVEVKHQNLMSLYSALGILWTLMFYNLSLKTINGTWTNFVVEVLYGPVQEQVISALLLLGIVGLNIYMLVDFLKLVFSNAASPFSDSISVIRSKVSSSQIQRSADPTIKTLKAYPLFSKISDEALKFIVDSSRVLSVKSGSPLIVQGQQLDRCYFLLEGDLEIFVKKSSGENKLVGRFSDQRLYGESALLGAKEQASSNILAGESTVVLELKAETFADLGEKEDFKEDYRQIKKQVDLLGYLRNVNLFAGMPHEVTNLLIQKGEDVKRGMGQEVITEGAGDRDFYVILDGRVHVEKGGKNVGELGKGDFFGEIALLANQPRTATIRVANQAFLLKISHDSFWELMAEYPSLGLFLEAVKDTRVKGDKELAQAAAV